jgi:aspartate carbamoyltransferase regulatory subunit
MRLVNGIQNGIVIDHIPSGKGMIVYNKLKLNEKKTPVVLLLNVESGTFGSKDIIKIDNEFDVDMNVLGLISKNITLNYIKDGALLRKEKVQIPQVVRNIFKCSNSRCISHTDDYAIPTFTLKHSNGEFEYQCDYCEEITKYKI